MSAFTRHAFVRVSLTHTHTHARPHTHTPAHNYNHCGTQHLIRSHADTVDGGQNVQLGYRNGQLTSENYHQMLDSSSTTALNGLHSLSTMQSANHSNVVDGEMQPPNNLECDNNNMIQASVCSNPANQASSGHSMPLQKDAMSCSNLNSDGMSSGQRSLLTLSSSNSPSNCTNQSDFDHLNGKQPHHPQCNQAGCNALADGGINIQHSAESDQLERGGSVIKLAMAHHNQLKSRDPAATTTTGVNGIIKQAKKSVSVESCSDNPANLMHEQTPRNMICMLN